MTFCRVFHLHNIELDTLGRSKMLARNLLVLGKYCIDLAEVDT